MQLLFLSGLGFLIGMEKTFFFFFQRHKIKGTTFFFVGIATVFLGWPLIGMILELYGSVLLFGYYWNLQLTNWSVIHIATFSIFSGFIPVAINFLRRLPGLNIILNLPGISSVSYLLMAFALSIVLIFFFTCRLLINWKAEMKELEFNYNDLM